MTRALVLALALAACGDEVIPASTVGARLMTDPSLSTSPFNAFSCATCHRVVVVPAAAPLPSAVERHPGPIYPGWNLYDVVHRPSWWGGAMTQLLDAMNYCLVEFMQGGPLDAEDDRARALYEYLASVSPDDPAPAMPFTVVKNVTPLAELAAGADAVRGEDVYARACRGCHGEPHTGDGRLGTQSSIIPEDTLEGPVCVNDPDPPACARAVVVEKVRHGRFFNIGGIMPLYAVEQMSDAEIADALAYLGL